MAAQQGIDGSEAFEALAHPARRQILTLLSQGEMSATDIVDAVDNSSRTAVSNHLRILRTSGLINERRQGRYRYYSVDPEAGQDVVGFVVNVYRESFAELQDAAAQHQVDVKPAKSRSRAG